MTLTFHSMSAIPLTGISRSITLRTVRTLWSLSDRNRPPCSSISSTTASAFADPRTSRKSSLRKLKRRRPVTGTVCELAK